MEEFASAWFKRDRLRASVISEMMHCQVMLAPIVAVPAFRHDHTGDFDIEGRKVPYLKAFSYSQAYNLLGLPSVAVPCGSSPEGLPIGVQVVGRPFDEETVLRVASILEAGLGGYRRPPI
jgi:amidase